MFKEGKGHSTPVWQYVPYLKRSSFPNRTLFSSHSSEACAAVYGSVIGGLEGNLCFAAAISALANEQLLFGLSTAVLLCLTASSAHLGLVLEALFSVEFLLACGEYKFVLAFLTSQCDVLIHDFSSLCEFFYPGRTVTATFETNEMTLIWYNALFKLHGHIVGGQASPVQAEPLVYENPPFYIFSRLTPKKPILQPKKGSANLPSAKTIRFPPAF